MGSLRRFAASDPHDWGTVSYSLARLTKVSHREEDTFIWILSHEPDVKWLNRL